MAVVIGPDDGAVMCEPAWPRGLNEMDTIRTKMLPTDQLAELVGRKHECLSQLHELGQQQLALVEASDLTALMHLLSTKQQLIAALKQIEVGLDPFRCEKPEERVWRSAAERAHCAARIEQSES